MTTERQPEKVIHMANGYEVIYDPMEETVYCRTNDYHAERLVLSRELLKKIGETIGKNKLSKIAGQTCCPAGRKVRICIIGGLMLIILSLVCRKLLIGKEYL
jgi:hypothetical protein